MAEAPRDRLPSGHDEEFVSEVDEDFHCLICLLALKHPVLTRCGHRFCKECLEEHFRRQEAQAQPYTCPADREGLEQDRDVFPDKATERKILSLAIKCPSEGCEWTDELRNKEPHLAVCPFKDVSCTNENCHVSLKRKDFEEHVTTTCEWRITECKYCTEPHPQCHMQDHIVNCNKYPVPCPKSCGDSVAREMVPDHVKEHCPMSLVSCPYVEVGCEEKVQRKNVESHIGTSIRHHLDLTCNQLLSAQTQLKRTQTELHETLSRLHAAQTQSNETKRQLGETRNQLQAAQAQSNQTKIQLKETQTQLNDAQMTIKKLERKVDTNTYIWKVNEFSKIKEHAKIGKSLTLSSPPFYTERYYGYKLKLIIIIDAAGPDIPGLRLVIMKGEYDAILPWPFNKKITVTLIDQNEDSQKRENIVHCWNPEIDLYNPVGVFTRPRYEENSGRWICWLFPERLEKRRYVLDDILFLQVEFS